MGDPPNNAKEACRLAPLIRLATQVQSPSHCTMAEPLGASGSSLWALPRSTIYGASSATPAVWGHWPMATSEFEVGLRVTQSCGRNQGTYGSDSASLSSQTCQTAKDSKQMLQDVSWKTHPSASRLPTRAVDRRIDYWNRQ